MRLVVVCAIAATGAVACRSADPARTDAHGSASVSIALAGTDVPAGPLLISLTRTRLIRLDQEGLAQPGLIERWTSSADHLTWTLRIRDGVRLQDGRLATPADVVDLIQQDLTSADRGPGLWAVTAVERVGEHDVRLRLREPTSLLLESLALVPAVPGGPYRAVDPEASEPQLHAVPQPGQPRTDIAKVQVRRFDTQRAAVAALLREDVDVLYEVPSETRDLLTADEGVHLFRHIKPYVITLGVNHRHPILSRRDVRLAMNAAIDRKALIAQAAGGVGVPAADVLWHQHWSRPHAADAELMRVDRERAGQLLDQAGFKRKPAAGGGVAPRFRVSCLVLDNPMMLRVAGRLQQAYADIGIDIDIQVLGLEDLGTRLSSGAFDAFVSPVVSGYGLGMPYVHFGAHTHPRFFEFGYTAAAPALERVRAATSDQAMAAAIAALHRVLIEDPPAVSLFWQETSRAVGRRITVPSGSTGDVLVSLPRWTVSAEEP
jgi:peptide/nickel transport system substrate-binding protein